MAIERPIFLVGAERSGTSLLRLLLDHHPDIAFQMEFEYAVDRLGPNGERPDMTEYRAWLRGNFVFQGSGFAIDETLEFRPLLDSFLEQKRQGKPIIGATIHRHFDRIGKIWPDARYIYLARDGRDVARSCIGMGWAGNAYAGCSEWIETVHAWDRLKATLPESAWLETRYEDLVADSDPEMSRILAWIGVPFTDAIYDYTKTSKYRRPDPKLAYQWKRKMAERDVRLVEARIGELLEKRGYERSGLPPIALTPGLRAQLTLENWWGRYSHRIRVYGLPCTVAETVAIRLGIKPLQERLRQRRYDIDHKRFA